ncbi:MAG TPA: AraC family transcriptional regulator [Xanthomonadales bacterium]|nr:AraC family transcriptional regulator [Xanthomonadales bacterium]
MAVDRLDALLAHFSVSARLFHAGALCGVNDFRAADTGQLHLVRSGRVVAQHAGTRGVLVAGPALIFYPRPLDHRFVTDAAQGADMACAHVTFRGGAINPVAAALPPFVTMPLARLPETAPVLELLFAEAFGAKCGRHAVIDRLFEVVLVHVLRALLDEGAVEAGLLAGLAHPKLARALVAMHADPARDWSLRALADAAGMSRSAFAAAFRACIGLAPGEYLARWRVCLAQDLLRRGEPLKRIAPRVGYGGIASLSRAFRQVCGASPRAWLNARA